MGKLKDAIYFSIREYPLGFPLDPEDEDFAGLRTPPQTVVSITYDDGDKKLRQSIMQPGLRKELGIDKIRLMKEKLEDWLERKLEP
jgi:hypothetical protein